MDADLGAMTVQRRDCRLASPVTRWSHSVCKDIGSNHEPLVTASSDGSAILSRLANAPVSDQKNQVPITFHLTAFSWKLTGANAGGRRQLPMWAPRAARVAQFGRSAK